MPSLTRRFWELFTLYDPEDEQEEHGRPRKKARHIDSEKVKKVIRPNAFRRIPTSVLLHIFQLYLDQTSLQSISENLFSPSSGRSPALSSSLTCVASPFILGLVCPSWRRLVRKSPRLWASLVVFKPSIRQIPVIKLWLDYSKTEPLSLYLCQPSEDGATATQLILEILTTHAVRWKHITIIINQFLPLMFPSYIAQVPLSVESLVLQCPPYDTTLDPWPLFYALRSLKRLSFSPEQLMNGLPPAPWMQLSHLKLHFVENKAAIKAFLHTIPYCVGLIELDVTLEMITDGYVFRPGKEDKVEASRARVATARLRRLSSRKSSQNTSTSSSSKWQRKYHHHKPQVHTRQLPRGLPTNMKTSGITKTRSPAVNSKKATAGTRMQNDPYDALDLPINLRKLRRLRINGFGENVTPLLIRLTSPALQSLHIVHYRQHGLPCTSPSASSSSSPFSSGSGRSIISFFQRSGTRNIHSLSIFDPDMDESELAGLFTSAFGFPQLVELELLVRQVTDVTVKALTLPSSQFYLQQMRIYHWSGGLRFPQLKRLVLPACHTSDGALLSMVESRRPGLGTLKFTMPPPPLLADDLRRLRSLEAYTSFSLVAF